MNDVDHDRGFARRPWLFALGLAVVTLIVFFPVSGYDFIGFDDGDYVYDNGLVQGGLSWLGVADAFTTTTSAHWHPLTMLSLMADVEFFGSSPGVFHRTNLALHILNVVLLFWLLHGMTGAGWRSAIVAAVFAIHPLHVEPVAWIASRKDVLSATFWLLCMAAYFRYAKAPKAPRFLPVLVLFVAGLMAKSILIMLPAVLFLVDYWPLGRFAWNDWRTVEGRTRLRLLLAEKLVLMPLAFVFLFINASAQQDAGQVGGLSNLSVIDRVGNAAVGYATYLAQTLWPSNLALYYPLPLDGYAYTLVALSVVLLVALTMAALRVAPTRPAIAVGWFWFLIVLAPVIGLVQLGAQAHADRYMYLPLIGLTITVVWGIGDGVPVAIRSRRLVVATALLVVGVLAFTARQQLGHWRDSSSAFDRAIAVTDENYLIHFNYGAALEQMGDPVAAARHYEAALAILPNHGASHNNLGSLCARRGDLEGAIEHFRAAASQPDGTIARCNLALALADSGLESEARDEARRAVDGAPDSVRARRTLEIVMTLKADEEEAS